MTRTRSGKTTFVQNMPKILRAMSQEEIPPVLRPLAQRIMNGHVVTISFNEKGIHSALEKFSHLQHDPKRALISAFGELILEHMRTRASKVSAMWSSTKRFCREFIFGKNFLDSWQDALQLLPPQGDILILIDEIDQLEDLWSKVSKVRLEKGVLFQALWDSILMLRDESLKGRFHVVVVGRRPNLFLRARNVHNTSPSFLMSMFLPPLKENHLKLAIRTTSIQGPTGIDRKLNILDVLRHACDLGDSETTLDEFVYALHRYTGGVPRCVVASLNGILGSCHKLHSLNAIDEALIHSITNQRVNDIDPLSSIIDEEAKEESADLFLSFALAAQCAIVLPMTGVVWFRRKFHKIVDLAALHNVWLDPIPRQRYQARVVVPLYSALIFQKSYKPTLRNLANDSRISLIIQSMQVGNSGTVGDLFEHIISRAITFSLLRSNFQNARLSVSQSSSSDNGVTWGDVLGGILRDTQLSSVFVPSRVHAGGLSKPIIGFNSMSSHDSTDGVTKKPPREWLQQSNRVKPNEKNALRIVLAAIKKHKIKTREELAVLHPPPHSEGYDFLLLQSAEQSIGVQAKCVVVLTAPIIRDEIKKTSKIIPIGGCMVLIIVTSGVVISERSKQYLLLRPGMHTLQNTRFKVPVNMDVVVVSTRELYDRNTISCSDIENIDKLLELKNGKVIPEEDVGHLFDILKGRPLLSYDQ